MLLLFSCPDNESDCFDLGSITRVENLISLEPIQTVYTQGTEVLLKMEVPAINTYFGNETNLLFQTGDFSPKLTILDLSLFENNPFIFVKGFQGEFNNWFYLPYNTNTGNYELEIIITLDKLGNYYFLSDESLIVKGETTCNRYRIDTNIAWSGTDTGIVEFSVVE